MPFSFGQNSGGGNNTPNKAMFGTGNSSGGSGSSLFGAASSTTNPGSGTQGASSLFGGGSTSGDTGGSGLFGNTSSSTTPNAPKSIFSGNQSTQGASQPASTGFSFGNTANNDPSPKPSLFGNLGSGNNTGSNTGAGGAAAAASSAPSFSFGTSASASTPAATPAANKTFSLPSTTPAGPPPGTSLFGGQSGQNNASSQSATSNLFGTKQPAASTSSTPGLFGNTTSNSGAVKPLGSSPTGSSLFNQGGSKETPTDANKNTQAQQSQASSTLFSGANPQGSPGSQGSQSTPKPSLFGNLGSTTPASTPASKPSGLSLGTTPASTQPASTEPASTQSTTAPASTFSLGGNKPPSASGAPASNMFSTGGTPSGGSGSGGLSFLNKSTAPPSTSAATTSSGTATSTSSSGTTTATSGPSLFPSLGATSAPSSSGAATTTSAAGSTLFPGLGGSKPTTGETQPSISYSAAPSGNAAGTTGTDASKGGMASSTAGPAPTAQSRLKNKSMDEIITRWGSDLIKYQKEFQTQAETVAKWDRELVVNSAKVKQLYTKTYQAERDAHEVERQLTMMEENQQELDSYLDRYEKEIDNMMKMHGVSGRSDGLRGPDQEREKTYKLAEKLQDRLNELNKDLTEMIEEINNTSQTLSKTGKPDDPLTKVVRVLNTQLSQLQLIDSGASQLQDKLARAQKEGQRIGANGWNGLGTDPADDFYRSFRGGRTERFSGVS